MSMKCDRCGEAFEYYDNSLCGNSIQKTLVNENKNLVYPSFEGYPPICLCPSCMAKLNDWLKGKQKRQAKWICDHESNSIECDKCGAEYKLAPYERESNFNYCPNCGAEIKGIKE